MQGPITLTRKDGLVTLHIGPTTKVLLKYPEYQSLKIWGSASPITAEAGTTFSTPKGRTRIQIQFPKIQCVITAAVDTHEVWYFAVFNISG